MTSLTRMPKIVKKGKNSLERDSESESDIDLIVPNNSAEETPEEKTPITLKRQKQPRTQAQIDGLQKAQARNKELYLERQNLKLQSKKKQPLPLPVEIEEDEEEPVVLPVKKKKKPIIVVESESESESEEEIIIVKKPKKKIQRKIITKPKVKIPKYVEEYSESESEPEPEPIRRRRNTPALPLERNGAFDWNFS